MEKGASLFLIFILLLSACTGGPEETSAPEVTEPPEITTAPPVTEAATTAPVPTTQPPVQPEATPAPTTPPPTLPPSKYSLQTTSPSEIIPEGASKVQPLTDTDYDFSLQFPPRIGIMVEGVKATYKTPTGSVYVLKYESTDVAADFFNAIVQKASWKGTPLTEKTLSAGGKTLKVYHKIEFNKYLGTVTRRGLFIYFVSVSAEDFTTEEYIKSNMEFLFDGEPETQPIPMVTKDVDFLSSSTSARDVIPEGAKSTAVISDSEYTTTIKYPSKTAGYMGDIKATYTLPSGKIYVSKFETAADAEAFLTAVSDRYARSGGNLFEKTFTSQGKSLTVYNRLDGGTYQATIIQKGVFFYYVAVSTDEFDAEYYIRRKLGYLYE